MLKELLLDIVMCCVVLQLCSVVLCFNLCSVVQFCCVLLCCVQFQCCFLLCCVVLMSFLSVYTLTIAKK